MAAEILSIALCS